MVSTRAAISLLLALAAIGSTAHASGPRWIPMSTRNAPPAARDRITVWTGERMLVFSPVGGGSFDPGRNRWTPISTEGLPGELLRDWEDPYDQPVLAGDRVVFLHPRRSGGLLHHGSEFVAAIYDVPGDRWTAVPFTADAPRPRRFPVVAWTGEGLIVWGGVGEIHVDGAGAQPEVLGDGAILDLDSGAWTPISSAGAPSPRSAAAGIWTGERLFVYGGLSRQGTADQLCHQRNPDRCVDAAGGALYDPVTDRWQPIDTAGAPPPRAGSTAMMSGDAVIVVGGTSAQGAAGVDGGVYHPGSDRWTPIPGTGVWRARCYLEQGYLVVSGAERRASVYDLETGQWRLLDAARLPPATGWTSSPITEPGMFEIATPNPGRPDRAGSVARIDPRSAAWVSSPFPAGEPPVSLQTRSVVWTGEKLIFWGGFSDEFDPDGSNGCGDVHRPCDPITPTKQVWHSAGAMFVPRFE